MRADSKILADLVKALSGTSRNGAHRWLEAMQVLIGDRKFSELQLARPGRPASARNGPHGCGSAHEDQRPEVRR